MREFVIDEATGLPLLPADMRWTVRPVQVHEVQYRVTSDKPYTKYTTVITDHPTDTEIVLEQTYTEEVEVPCNKTYTSTEQERARWWGSATRDVEVTKTCTKLRTEVVGRVRTLYTQLLGDRHQSSDYWGDNPAGDGWEQRRHRQTLGGGLWVKLDELSSANILKRANQALILYLDQQHELAIAEDVRRKRDAARRANDKVRSQFTGTYPPRKLGA